MLSNLKIDLDVSDDRAAWVIITIISSTAPTAMIIAFSLAIGRLSLKDRVVVAIAIVAAAR